ncbi:hypothetical protein THII_2995 [Thioploca ingrica]|uniref:Uncharacterized protein n=1 Tax=Thioploca ingrica TaxID=40754 RepID=A0A090AMR0_9GAMM|nr:hypothetical protein THII_2995 [Thioploca ingrica]
MTTALALTWHLEVFMLNWLYALERVTPMPFLPSMRALSFLGKIWLDRLFLITVTAGWFVAVAAVWSQPPAQLNRATWRRFRKNCTMSKREAKLLVTDILEAIDKASRVGNDKPVAHPT